MISGYALALRLDWLGSWVWVQAGGVDFAADDHPDATVLEALDIDAWTDQLDVSGGSSSNSLDVELVLPLHVSAAAAIASGNSPAGRTVELARVRVDDGVASWSSRVRLARGYVDTYEIDEPDDPIRLRVTGYAFDRSDPVPSRLLELSAESAWSLGSFTVDDQRYGTPYPIVFGQPVDVPSTPGVVVHVDTTASDATQSVLVSAGHLEATQATIHVTEKPIASWTCALTKTKDALGNPITVFNHTDTPGVRDTDFGEYWFSFDFGAATPDLGVGDVVQRLLGLGSVTYDRAATDSVLGELNAYRLSGYIDEPVDPLDWIQDRLLGTFPVARADAGAGLRLVPVRWRATRTDALTHLEAGDGRVVRASTARATGAGRPVEVEARYKRNGATGKFTASALQRDSAAIVSHPGIPARVVRVDLPDVYDAPTAEAVAAYHVWLNRPKTRVELLLAADVDDHASLRAGDVVTVSDDDLAWTQRVALVERVTWSWGAWIEVQVVLV